MRKIPVYLMALCLTLGVSAAFAATTPKVPQKTTAPVTKPAPAKPAPATPTKAGAHHHHHHGRHAAPRPATKKG